MSRNKTTALITIKITNHKFAFFKYFLHSLQLFKDNFSSIKNNLNSLMECGGHVKEFDDSDLVLEDCLRCKVFVYKLAENWNKHSIPKRISSEESIMFKFVVLFAAVAALASSAVSSTIFFS